MADGLTLLGRYLPLLVGVDVRHDRLRATELFRRVSKSEDMPELVGQYRSERAASNGFATSRKDPLIEAYQVAL